MCANYSPTRADILQALFGFPLAFTYTEDVFPGGLAPAARLNREGELDVVPSHFGLMPPWAKEQKFARSTYNARTETVAEKPAFRNAWKRRQFCAVPMQAFYEPNYESGRAVRWRIERDDKAAFFAAGLWEWRPLDAEVDASTGIAPRTQQSHFSHTLLTVNADDHPFMKRFHKPGDEKRSIIVFGLAHARQWLALGKESADLTPQGADTSTEALLESLQKLREM